MHFVATGLMPLWIISIKSSNEDEMKMFQNKPKLKVFISTHLALKIMCCTKTLMCLLKHLNNVFRHHPVSCRFTQLPGFILNSYIT